MALRKTIELPLFDNVVQIDVDMRVIEIVERVYDANVDLVAAVILTDPMRVKLTQVAEVVSQWLKPSHLEELDIKRKDIKEAIFSASHEDVRVIVGCIQAACLFVRRHIDEEQFDKLTQGEDLDDEDSKKKSSTTSETSDGTESSTESS